MEQDPSLPRQSLRVKQGKEKSANPAGPKRTSPLSLGRIRPGLRDTVRSAAAKPPRGLKPPRVLKSGRLPKSPARGGPNIELNKGSAKKPHQELESVIMASRIGPETPGKPEPVAIPQVDKQINPLDSNVLSLDQKPTAQECKPDIETKLPADVDTLPLLCTDSTVDDSNLPPQDIPTAFETLKVEIKKFQNDQEKDIASLKAKLNEDLLQIHNRLTNSDKYTKKEVKKLVKHVTSELQRVEHSHEIAFGQLMYKHFVNYVTAKIEHIVDSKVQKFINNELDGVIAEKIDSMMDVLNSRFLNRTTTPAH